MTRLLLGLTLISLTGCVVYKSSDRSDFDTNGKSRAPAPSKPTGTAVADCVQTSDLNPDEIAASVTTAAGRLVQLPDGSLHAICENQNSAAP